MSRKRAGLAWTLRAAALTTAACVTTPAQSQPAPLNTYYGLLHAHTSFSDGSGTPEEAYAAAKAAGVSFFAVTEHNHAQAEDSAGERRDGLLIATNHALYDAPGQVTFTPNDAQGNPLPARTARSVIAAATAATDASFVALYGQEFSTISSGNHVNVFNVPRVLDLPDGNFRALYERLASDAGAGPLPIVQLNHPDVHADLFAPPTTNASEKKKRFNDYGIDDADYGPDFRTLVDATDRFVALIEVLSGPATKEGPVVSNHYKYTGEDDYYFYLVQGFHVSPSAGQDNHYKTWGTITAARTGVLASELTADAILAAFRANRTFATEDKNLDVRLSLATGETMGSSVMRAVDTPLVLEVQIADADEPQAAYEVELIHGNVAPGRRDEVPESRAEDGVIPPARTRSGNGIVSFSGLTAQGDPEFFYVSVRQVGDGDRAWTAPIWVNHGGEPAPTAQFVWTKSTSSKVYHLPGCPSADQIKQTNRVEGATPPPGRTQHDCPVAPAGDDH